MIIADISRNLNDIETKIAFGLTKRQILCFLVAGIIGFPVFFFLKSYVPGEIATFGMIIAVLPCMIFGFYKKNRYRLEDIISHIWQSKFVRPKVRPYRTENQYMEIEEAIAWRKEIQKHNGIKKGRKKAQSKGSKKKIRSTSSGTKAAASGAKKGIQPNDQTA